MYGYSINDQAYFYTLSTISQTLAAIIGIISGFIIYRLQALRSEKSENINQFVHLVYKAGLNDKFPRLDVDFSYDKLRKINEIIKKEFQGEDFTQSEITRITFELMINTVESKIYKENFSFPLRMGALVIIITFILLPLGQITLPDKSLFPIFNTTLLVGEVVALSIFVVLSITESLIMIFETDD